MSKIAKISLLTVFTAILCAFIPYYIQAGGNTFDGTVTITNPANSSTVDGTVSITVSAWDSDGISGIQVGINSTPNTAMSYSSGAGTSSGDPAIYTYSWNTTLISDGTYTIDATASDNRTPIATKAAAQISVTVYNPVDMDLTEVVVSQASNNDVEQGSQDVKLLMINFKTVNPDNATVVNSIQIHEQCTSINDLDSISGDAALFWTGSSLKFNTTTQLGTTQNFSGEDTYVTFSSLNRTLSQGNNYIWLAVNIDASASVGNTVDAYVVSGSISVSNDANSGFTETTFNPAGSRKIVTSLPALPEITFVSPTPDHNAVAAPADVKIKADIYPGDYGLVGANFTWGATSYVLMSSDLRAMFNFDKVTALGETNISVLDMSGYGYNATANNDGMYSSSGKYGGSYFWDGTTADYLTFSGSAVNRDSGTVEMWVYPNFDDKPSTNKYFFDVDGSRHAFFQSVNEFYSLNVNGRYRNYWVTFSSANWHHFVFVYEKSSDKLDMYINGIKQTNVYVAGGTWGTTAVGAKAYIGTRYIIETPFDGYIDELRVWNRPLTATEIQQHYMSNLSQYDPDKWYFYVNQQKTPGVKLDNGTYNYRLTASNDDGSNQSELRTVIVQEPATIVWDGSESTNWNTAANWDMDQVPTSNDTVIIPNVANKPGLNSAVSVSSITIQSGAVLNLNNYNFTVAEDIYISGQLTASNTEQISIGGNWYSNSGSTFTAANSTVTFNGASTTKTILSSGTSFYNFLINGSTTFQLSDELNVANNFTVQSGTIDCGSLSMTVSGKFRLETGTEYKAPSGTLMIGGDTTLAGGTFTRGTGGTVRFFGNVVLDSNGQNLGNVVVKE